MPVKLKRIYDDCSADDGMRVLVDRVWPRGISKEDAAIDLWAKDVAPSSELRKWFNHDADKYADFKVKYKAELKSGDQKESLDQLKETAKKHKKHLTLLYAAKDEQHNQAQVLKEILDHQNIE